MADKESPNEANKDAGQASRPKRRRTREQQDRVNERQRAKRRAEAAAKQRPAQEWADRLAAERGEEPVKVTQGRPSGYSRDILPVVSKMWGIGCSFSEIADALQISVRTLDNWRARHPELNSCMLRNDQCTDRVVRALYQKATGGYRKKVKLITPPGAKTADEVIKVEYDEYVEPDVSAINKWLGSRAAKEWPACAPGVDDGVVPAGKLMPTPSDPVAVMQLVRTVMGMLETAERSGVGPEALLEVLANRDGDDGVPVVEHDHGDRDGTNHQD